MKKCILLFMVIFLLLSFSSCSETKNTIHDYQYIYNVVDDWNKTVISDANRNDLFGVGPYLYNSHLILFPRETPSSLEEFFYFWEQGIDVNRYAIYFTCKLTENNYQGFVSGLDAFEVKSSNTTTKLLRDNSHFPLPAYILQWSEVKEKWEVLEYILLDEDNHTVVFVYTMSCLPLIEANSNYTITPNVLDILDNADYSIYNNFENAEYDTSFLEYLS